MAFEWKQYQPRLDKNTQLGDIPRIFYAIVVQMPN